MYVLMLSIVATFIDIRKNPMSRNLSRIPGRVDKSYSAFQSIAGKVFGLNFLSRYRGVRSLTYERNVYTYTSAGRELVNLSFKDLQYCYIIATKFDRFRVTNSSA